MLIQGYTQFNGFLIYFEAYWNYKIQTSMKKRDSFIPFREINWKKYAYLHNRLNNIFYDCECGKRYVSFPAIYLHFQRKHKKKLSNRQEPPQCQIRKKDNQLVYFYYIPMKRQNSSNLSEKQTNIWVENNNFSRMRPILANFMNQEKQYIKAAYNLKFFQQILVNLEKFINYLELSQEDKNLMNQCQLAMSLPLHFNDFVLNELKEENLCTQNYYELCKILLHLSKWLNKKNISNLIVQLNQEPGEQNTK